MKELLNDLCGYIDFLKAKYPEEAEGLIDCLEKVECVMEYMMSWEDDKR